ncbi:MAG: hypothetical protein E7173_01320 [Firmicutes bacterium]|nr:hypothetical protein [Bacillota bacterium]
MRKYIILLIIVIVVAALLVIASSMGDSNYKSIEKYLKYIGFTKYEDTNLYLRQESEYDADKHEANVKKGVSSEYTMLSFNIEDYHLTKDRNVYKDLVNTSYVLTYNYNTGNVDYNYRINFQNSNVLIEGIFDVQRQQFKCNPTFSYQLDLPKVQQIMCKQIKYEVDIFVKEAQEMIDIEKIQK